MPITYDEKVLKEFFGVEPTYSNVEDCELNIIFYEYSGKHLKYSFFIDHDNETIMVSGDNELPFGGDSMYELGLPCDSIIKVPDGYYPHQTGLGFYYGETSQQYNLTLMLLKRPDGDLKVWPNTNWPTRHKFNEYQSTDRYTKTK